MQATFTGFQLTDSETTTGRRYFVATYTANNYNDVAVTCMLDPFMTKHTFGQTMIVTNVQIHHVGTIGVELTYIYFSLQGNNGVYLPHHTTTKAIDTHAISGLVVPIMVPGGPTFNVWPTGYAATDDMTITFQGYVEGTKEVGPAQSVSIEGYKWPLIRR